ncbi:MAG: hypothetical protein E6Q97_31190 [Desulfurellales bacterium]|nr:MAG: hypothetical protein E6Q97_31190 [Desulfurellales bacterium]
MSSMEEADKAAAAVSKEPRVSLADIEAQIASEYRFTAADAVHGLTPPPPIVEPLKILSICILVMKNGFTVIGKSAPASPANYNRELGFKFARDDAIRQLWPLMGFNLRQHLYEGSLLLDEPLPADPTRVDDVGRDLHTDSFLVTRSLVFNGQRVTHGVHVPDDGIMTDMDAKAAGLPLLDQWERELRAGSLKT